ncbi:hypothetical protein F4803DRAFT_549887 [Xylaria telfairii]|nr:hypothetical protein F4803DRAFT_549887 [Xylaria telfairii]
MAQQQPLETLDVPLVTLGPLNILNEFRARQGLPPSRNLISSAIFMTKTELGNRLPYPRDYSLHQNDNNNNSALIVDKQNCRLWITGLPAQCTVHTLLEGIRGIGPVFACHIITSCAKPWDTAAASLTFFTADAANRFLERAAVQPFTVAKHIAKVSRHRIHAESTHVNGRSRVLRIVGDPMIVRPQYLAQVFSENWLIRFDTDFIHFHTDSSGAWNEIIWAFGSFRGQAQVIYAKINRYYVGLARAMYLADPCIF